MKQGVLTSQKKDELPQHLAITVEDFELSNNMLICYLHLPYNEKEAKFKYSMQASKAHQSNISPGIALTKGFILRQFKTKLTQIIKLQHFQMYLSYS